MAMTCINGAKECEGCGNCIDEEHIGNCENCSEPIFKGEEHYEIDDILLHEDCLYDWASQFKKE